MELPLLSRILKHFRRGKTRRRLEARRQRLITRAAANAVVFDKRYNLFTCPCCRRRHCSCLSPDVGKDVVSPYQAEYDAITAELDKLG